jgi:hypothetical protein
MSYDLMVFDPAAPPADRKGFMAWYHDRVNWDPDLNYNDPKNCSPQLLAWLHDMLARHPAMNGPYAPSNEDFDDTNDVYADYSIGKSSIYVTFAWSAAERAYRAMFELAKKHRLGFFDVSANDGEVWMPGPHNTYVRVHGGDNKEPPKTTIWSALGIKVLRKREED